MAYFDSVKLEKGMYHTPKKSFSQVLEELDPSQQYENSELEGLDAFQRQLRRFDIKVSGENSDIVDRFFQSSESASLFPEYVSRAVAQGMAGVVMHLDNQAVGPDGGGCHSQRLDEPVKP